MEIAPAAPASASAFSSLTKNIDTFLTLLTTQLRNQDPLEPLDTEKFTSQLVQFASVEQSIKANSHLEALIRLQAASERDSALAFVGRTAMLATDLAAHDGAGATWTYALPENAGATSLAVVDAAGRIVAAAPGETRRGQHAFIWNGLLADGRAAPAGVYKLVVTSATAEGRPIAAAIETSARITGAQFTADGALLETATGLMPLSAVRRVAADQI